MLVGFKTVYCCSKPTFEENKLEVYVKGSVKSKQCLMRYQWGCSEYQCIMGASFTCICLKT